MKWYEINNIDSIDSPALVIYPERILENIRQVKRMVHNDVTRLRPHVKTSKIAEVCSMMLEEGITKFKCATIAEAEMLAIIKAPDVLLAYQPVGPKITRLIKLVKQYPATHFSCLVDNIESANELSQKCIDYNLILDVFIDLNTGMNRTGVHPAKALLFFEALDLLAGINVVGLHAYDGHIHDSDLLIRRKNVEEGLSKVIIIAEAVEAISNKKLIIVAGGSPTFPIHAQRKNIECSPGTFIYWDWGYKNAFPDEPFNYAALVITRIISIIDEHTITTDLGHKAIAAENPLPRVYLLNAPDVIPVAQSEEHLVINVADGAVWKVGAVLYGVPVHICPTVALYQSAMVIQNNTSTGEWKVIARDRKISV